MCPVIMKRFKFNSRFKHPSESLSTFIADLHKLAEHCEYGHQMSDPSVIVHPRLNKTPVTMTSVAISIVSKKAYGDCWKEKLKPLLKTTSAVLRTCNGDVIKIMGKDDLKEYNNPLQTLPLLVVDGNGPNLLGNDWLRQIKLDWCTVYSCETGCDRIMRKFSNVFFF